MNITVYSASSGQVPTTYIKAAQDLGRLIAINHHTLINGAGRTGLMGACADACIEQGGKAIGKAGNTKACRNSSLHKTCTNAKKKWHK